MTRPTEDMIRERLNSREGRCSAPSNICSYHALSDKGRCLYCNKPQGWTDAEWEEAEEERKSECEWSPIRGSLLLRTLGPVITRKGEAK